MYSKRKVSIIVRGLASAHYDLKDLIARLSGHSPYLMSRFLTVNITVFFIAPELWFGQGKKSSDADAGHLYPDSHSFRRSIRSFLSFPSKPANSFYLFKHNLIVAKSHLRPNNLRLPIVTLIKPGWGPLSALIASD